MMPADHNLETNTWTLLLRYRTALKPVYQVKQKVLESLQWKCCPGFIGKDCEQRGKESQRACIGIKTKPHSLWQKTAYLFVPLVWELMLYFLWHAMPQVALQQEGGVISLKQG